MNSHYETTSAGSQNCGRQNLQTGVTILQIAEGSIHIVVRNLQRMKQLATEAQAQQDIQEKNRMKQEFNELVDQNQDIALNTSFNDISLHQDNQTINITVDDEADLTFTTRSLPEMHFAFHDYNTTVTSIETYLDKLHAHRAHLAKLLNTVKNRLNYTPDTTIHRGHSVRVPREDHAESDTDTAGIFFG